MPLQGSLHLAQLDAVPVNLNLKVLPSQKLNIAVREIAPQIARYNRSPVRG